MIFKKGHKTNLGRKQIRDPTLNKKVFVKCECGIKVFGNSPEMANANLGLHQISKRHALQASGSDIVPVQDNIVPVQNIIKIVPHKEVQVKK